MPGAESVFEACEWFPELSRGMAEESALSPAALDKLLELTVTIVPGVQAATLTRRQRSFLVTAESTDETAATADKLQFAAGQGPTFEAMDRGAVAFSDDLAADSRWPAVDVAQAVGVRALLCFPVQGPRGARSVLNLYRNELWADPAERDRALLIGAAAALAFATLLHRQRVENLEIALDNNRRIGAATGILMARNNWTEQHAFDEMLAVSHRRHQKLRAVAEQVVYTGALPPVDGLPDLPVPPRPAADEL